MSDCVLIFESICFFLKLQRSSISKNTTNRVSRNAGETFKATEKGGG